MFKIDWSALLSNALVAPNLLFTLNIEIVWHCNIIFCFNPLFSISVILPIEVLLGVSLVSCVLSAQSSTLPEISLHSRIWIKRLFLESDYLHLAIWVMWNMWERRHVKHLRIYDLYDFYFVNCRLNSVGVGWQVRILHAASLICVIITRHNTCKIILNLIISMAMMMIMMIAMMMIAVAISIFVEIILGWVWFFKLNAKSKQLCVFVWF